VSYEYLYPQPEKLSEKPFKADELMKKIEALGLKPVIVVVDNVRGSVVVCFTSELGRKEKKALDEGMVDIFKAW
jgi:hypothetical protein